MPQFLHLRLIAEDSGATQSCSYKPEAPVLGGSTVPKDSQLVQGREIHSLSGEGLGVQRPRTPPMHKPSSLPKEEGSGRTLHAKQWQQLQAESLVAFSGPHPAQPVLVFKYIIHIAIYMANIDYFLCPSNYSKYFTHINSFNLHNSPMIIRILQQGS